MIETWLLWAVYQAFIERRRRADYRFVSLTDRHTLLLCMQDIRARLMELGCSL